MTVLPAQRRSCLEQYSIPVILEQNEPEGGNMAGFPSMEKGMAREF